MQKYALVLVALLALSALATAATYENASVVGQVPDRVVITVQSGVKLSVEKSAGFALTGIESLDAVSLKHGVSEIQPLYGDMVHRIKNDELRDELSRVYTVDFPAAAGLQNVLADYRKVDVVAKTEAVDICRTYGNAYMPNDLNTAQYYLRNAALGGGDIRALGGWAETLGDSNIVVAVIDSGVDWHHPDLGGSHPDRVNGAIWTNWDEYYGTPGVDDDANGKIDDIRGWDFVNLPSQLPPPYDDQDVVGQDNDPMDYESHGTNCAGVVAPITDNGIGIAGTAPGCKIMALRVGWLPVPDPGEPEQGVVRMDFAASGIVYAAVNGAQILNTSWGSSEFLSGAVRTALDAGCLIFTAAGNDSDDEPSYLGGYNDDAVLAVAATNADDGKAEFSNFGEWVDLSAPGVNIYTTAYDRSNQSSTYTSTQGTSFSSPLACGAAALIWSTDPTMTAYDVSAIILASCDNIDDINPGYAGLLGAGRVNLLKALGDNVQLVPQEFVLLRDAINSAAQADTIKVLGSETLGVTTFLGKGMQIRGGYDPGYETRDPMGNPTVISGNPNNPAVQFSGTIGNDTVIDGFQVQNGGGRFFADIPFAAKYGGGMVLSGTSPTLRNLTITGNNAGSASELGLGGGIALNNSNAVLENVLITGNTSVHGAGVYIYRGAPTLTDVTIADNTVITDNLSNPALGGGLRIIDSDVTLNNVTISGHLAAENGGGLHASGVNDVTNLVYNGGAVTGNTAKTNGGGIFIAGGSLELVDVEVSGNSKTDASTFMAGGGLFAQNTAVTLDGAVIADNLGQTGGGLQLNNCTDVQVLNTVITGNMGEYFAGTFYLNNCTTATVQNVTIADNNCPAGGAGLYSSNTVLTLENTISAFNTGGTGTANGIYLASGSGTFACNDVFGNDGTGWGGVADPTGTDGNIAADPLFCDVAGGDYRVDPDGPCAPDNSGGCGLIGALEADCGTTNAVEDPAVPMAFRVDQNYPNPFNPITTIRFALPTTARTTVVVYDVKGRLVKTLVDADLVAATHSVQWKGDDDRGRSAAAGIYFYKVTSGSHSAVGRMALIK